MRRHPPAVERGCRMTMSISSVVRRRNRRSSEYSVKSPRRRRDTRAGTGRGGARLGLRDAALPDDGVDAAQLDEVGVGIGKAEIGEDVAAPAFHGGVGGFHGVSLHDACHVVLLGDGQAPPDEVLVLRRRGAGARSGPGRSRSPCRASGKRLRSALLAPTHWTGFSMMVSISHYRGSTISGQGNRSVRQWEAPKSVGSNGETVFRLKGEQRSRSTLGRSTVDVGYFDPTDFGASQIPFASSDGNQDAIPIGARSTG